jgi:sugar O-acyltransferase (sialic acid O-acetyltransferase NeuD family)
MEDTLLNKRRLFIIGAGDFGRELESWLELMPETTKDWYIEGYLDSGQELGEIKDYPSDYKIVGNETYYPFKKNDLVIISIADPATKEVAYNILKGRVAFLTYIAPNAILGKFNQIGEGCIICPNCILTTNIILGNCVTLNVGTQIGHDARIGNFSSLMPNVDIGGDCELGCRVYLGTNSTIVPRKKIADDVKISAGSIVTRSIQSKTVVFGNPAVKLRD